MQPKKLTMKQRHWLREYLKTGNATQSALKAYDCTPNSAKNIGYENVAKLDLGVIMDAKGLTDDNLMNHAVEGLTKPIKVTGDGIETPDYGVRHRYLETTLRLKGHGKDTKVEVNIDNRKQYAFTMPVTKEAGE